MNNEKKFTKRKTSWALAAMVMILITFTVATSYGATWNYYLQAGVTTIPAGTYNASPAVPNENILMWGYQICLDGTYALCGSPAVGGKMPPVTAADIVAGVPTFPGPVLVASENDTLNIHLRNNLTSIAANAVGFPSMITEPTSLIIFGQNGTTLNPTWVSVTGTGGVIGITSTGSRLSGDVTSRVRSFTPETPDNGSTVQTYTWSALTPGTYLYESGTHPAVQVQMGLYGALKVYPVSTPATPGAVPPKGSISPTYVKAYNDTSTEFNSEVTLVFSEIDQELHYSVSSGLYGIAPPPPPAPAIRGQRTSTVTFAPNFFLINGKPHTATSTPIPAGFSNAKNLIRLVNAGVREKTPTLIPNTGSFTVPLYMKLIAEDGNPYMFTTTSSAVGVYFSKQQYETLLAAGKTMDAIVEPSTTAGGASTVSMFDRSLNLTNSNLTGGGMLASLSFAAGPASPLSAPLPLTVTSPAAVNTWKLGSSHNIVWTYSTPPGSVKIDLIQSGSVVRTIIAQTSGNNGYYDWSLPTNLVPGYYKIMVTSISTRVSAESASFTISK